MKKLAITTIIFFVISAACAHIQNTYYGYVDEQGILRDSLFLPLSVVFLALGVSCLLVLIARRLFKK